MRQRNLRGRPPALPGRLIGEFLRWGVLWSWGRCWGRGAGGEEVGALVAQVAVQRALKNDVPRVLHQPWPAVAGAMLADALCQWAALHGSAVPPSRALGCLVLLLRRWRRLLSLPLPLPLPLLLLLLFAVRRCCCWLAVGCRGSAPGAAGVGGTESTGFVALNSTGFFGWGVGGGGGGGGGVGGGGGGLGWRWRRLAAEQGRKYGTSLLGATAALARSRITPKKAVGSAASSSALLPCSAHAAHSAPLTSSAKPHPRALQVRLASLLACSALCNNPLASPPPIRPSVLSVHLSAYASALVVRASFNG